MFAHFLPPLISLSSLQEALHMESSKQRTEIDSHYEHAHDKIDVFSVKLYIKVTSHKNIDWC